MALFSILATVREAYSYRKVDKELIKQYRSMHRIFADARAALAVYAEWAMMHRQRPLEHGKF